MTSYKCHSICKTPCLAKNKDNTKVHINDLFRWIPSGGRFPSQRVSNADRISCHDLFLDQDIESMCRANLSPSPPGSKYPALLWRHNGRDGVSITSLTIVYSTVYSGADQRKHQSSASLAFVRGTHQWPAGSPHKGPVTRKMFPFDDVFMVDIKSLNASKASIHSWTQ